MGSRCRRTRCWAGASPCEWPSSTTGRGARTWTCWCARRCGGGARSRPTKGDPEVHMERRNMDEKKTGTLALKTGLAEMLKGGVIMDVTTDAQARIAEDAGAVAAMALERVPADIRRERGAARMADAEVVERIMNAVTIPVMAKCRIGHFAEARLLEALGVDFVD